jgi:pimeloyl-ACP methyl ester carboxylesterase
VDRVRVDAFLRFDARMTERQARWFEQRVPGSRVVRIPNASHYAFLSHAEDVLREIDAFLRTLP